MAGPLLMRFTQARRWDGVGRGGQGKGLINRAQPGLEGWRLLLCGPGRPKQLRKWHLHWLPCPSPPLTRWWLCRRSSPCCSSGAGRCRLCNRGGHASSQCIPPCPHAAHCAHGAHVLAGLVATGLEHSRDGVSVADGAEVFLTGGLQGAECRVGWVRRPGKWVCTTHTVVLMCSELVWPHSPGRQLPPAQMQRLGVPASVPPGPAPPH